MAMMANMMEVTMGRSSASPVRQLAMEDSAKKSAHQAAHLICSTQEKKMGQH